MNNYTGFLLFLAFVLIAGFFLWLLIRLKKERRRMEEAIVRNKVEHDQIANEAYAKQIARFLHEREAAPLTKAEVDVYQSRADRRKNGERGGMQLRATLPQKQKKAF